MMMKTLQSIQFLRFVAATVVAFAHAMLFLKGFSREALGIFLDDLSQAGVQLFFVISGFIMVYTCFPNGTQRMTPSEFLSRRFIRIFPSYWIYGAFYVIFATTFTTNRLSPVDILGSALLLPGYSGMIIAQGWTLSFEIYFYICFALIMTLRLETGLTVMTAAYLICIFLLRPVVVGGDFLQLITSPLLLDFLFGAWIGYFVVSGMRLNARAAAALALVGCLGFLVVFIFELPRVPKVASLGIPSALLIAGLIFTEIGGKPNWLIDRLAFLGDSSYSLYLLHEVIFSVLLVLFANLISAYNPTSLSILLIAVMMSAIAIYISHFAYRTIESPTIKKLRIYATSKLA